MALSPSDVQWFKTKAGGYILEPVTAGKLHDVAPAIRVGDSTSYTLVGLVNSHPTDSLSSAGVYLSVESGGVAVAIGKSAAGIVVSSGRLAVDTADPITGVTYSTPVTATGSIFVGTLAAGNAIGFWVRRIATGGSVKSPETATLIVTGTSTI